MKASATTLAALLPTFEALKPGLARDYTERAQSVLVDLLARYEGRALRELGSREDRDGKNYRVYRQLVLWGGYRIDSPAAGIDHERLEREAKGYADDQVAAFTSKLMRKLGNLDDVEIRGLDVGGFEFRISGRLGEHRVYVDQSRIINCSPKGKLFHQWPARIYVDGKATSEAAFKRLAARTRP